MTEPVTLTLTGAEVLTEDGLCRDAIGLEGGLVSSGTPGRAIDLSGCRVLPGIIDVHGDAFERHVAPRRGAMKDLDQGILAAEAEMAANGVTTGVLAQFVSWEGGVRGRDFADGVFRAIARSDAITTLISQLRFETHLFDMYDELPDLVEEWGVGYVVFNDHLPHERLAEGRRPKRLTGQALKAGRNPDVHFQMLLDMHARTAEVPAALDAACAELLAKGVRIGSHDDQSRSDREVWFNRGAEISEFPEFLDAAEGPGLVVMGAPNLVRGSSHKGNVSALDIVMMELCDALASDYHYPSLRRAALMLEPVIGLQKAWALVSSGPARVLGFTDRGVLRPGARADLVVLDSSNRIGAVMSGGRFSFLSGEVAARIVVGQAGRP